MASSESLSEIIDAYAGKVVLIEGTKFHRLSNRQEYNLVSGSHLKMDSRAGPRNRRFYASVFEGLQFDKKRTTSQAYFITDANEYPVAITTFVIEPRLAISGKKYLIRKENGVKVAGYEEAIGQEIPNFNFSFAWTRVNPIYQGKFARSGFKFLLNSLGAIIKFAPDKTYLEICAQGHMRGKLSQLIKSTFEGKPGEFIPNKELIFDPEIIGQYDLRSISTKKFAEKLNAKLIENVGVLPTLGPVFIKRLK